MFETAFETTKLSEKALKIGDLFGVINLKDFLKSAQVTDENIEKQGCHGTWKTWKNGNFFDKVREILEKSGKKVEKA